MRKYDWVLHLDLNFTPEAEGAQEIGYDLVEFNGGERHIKLKLPAWDHEYRPRVLITVQGNSSDKIMLVMLAVDALERGEAGATCSLFMPYFPYARQDRRMVEGEPLSVKVMANILNIAYFENVIMFDPHSDVAPALVDEARALPNYGLVGKAIDDIIAGGIALDDIALVSPDGGALKKVSKLATELDWGGNIVYASKHRDPATGRLSQQRIENPNDAVCVIVDDICDGGRTFNTLADLLHNVGAEEARLVVSHGIFSAGFADLLQQFAKIYTTNSFRALSAEELYGPKKAQVVQYKLQLDGSVL